MPASDPTPAEETRAILSKCRALLSDDHFVYFSGNHGNGCLAKDVIFVDLARVKRLAAMLAELVGRFGADILCGPATGGLIVAHRCGQKDNGMDSEQRPTKESSEWLR